MRCIKNSSISEALQFTADEQGATALKAFCPEGFVIRVATTPTTNKTMAVVRKPGDAICFYAKDYVLNEGDWLIKSPTGEFSKASAEEFSLFYQTFTK